jgi:hypothetical protein
MTLNFSLLHGFHARFAAVLVLATVFAVPALAVAQAGIHGFGNGSDFTINTNGVFTPTIVSNALTITQDDSFVSANSVFCNTTQVVQGFTASFLYQPTWTQEDENPADGITFVVQNDPAGAQALGFWGGDLGYSNEQNSSSASITQSVAVALNIWAGHVQGTSLLQDGQNPSFSYTATGSVNLASGDPIKVVLKYNGVKLTETLTDTVTAATYTTSYTIDIPAVVGAPTAYVGFTGATGGGSSTQTISDFSFVPASEITAFTIDPNQVSAPGPNVALDVTTEGTFSTVTVSGAPGGFVGTPPTFSLTQNGNDWTATVPSSFLSSAKRNVATLIVNATRPNGTVAHAGASIGCMVKTPMLALTLAGPAHAVKAGKNVTLAGRVADKTAIDADDASVQIVLPAGVTYVSSSAGSTYDSSTNTVTWSGTLPAGSAAQPISLTVQTASDLASGTELTFDATATADWFVPVTKDATVVIE